MTALSDHRNRAADLGLRETSTGSCPRRLVRLPHQGDQCWCTSRLNDHGRRYRDDHRPLVMWEPYDAGGTELADVLAAAASDGLRVTVTGYSPWNPGATVALMFTADGNAPRPTGRTTA